MQQKKEETTVLITDLRIDNIKKETDCHRIKVRCNDHSDKIVPAGNFYENLS